ncbi:MAG: hypothetical protein K0Q87_5338 [Neobacillus sp.]|jgi:hypothetical protein|nr:hypothetical protein [Neobacillus sp.]
MTSDVPRSYVSICFLNDVPLHVIQKQPGHETLQQTLDYIKDLISEQEGRKYLEGTVLFAKEPEKYQKNKADDVVDFNAIFAAKLHKQAH